MVELMIHYVSLLSIYCSHLINGQSKSSLHWLVDDKESLIDSWITWTFILSNHLDNSKARHFSITKLQTWYSAVGKKESTIF